MNNVSRIKELETIIDSLPPGSITKKKINNKVYFYYRWKDGERRREKYLPFEEVDTLRDQIAHRKALEKELKELGEKRKKTSSGSSSSLFNILTGNELRAFSSPVSDFKKRECFKELNDFILEDNCDKVFILYGLRRTGKTTLIRQILFEMSDIELEKTAFIQITPKDTLYNLFQILNDLKTKGFIYVFVDEVTLLDDFIGGSALLSDVFASCGMKIVLSGTDSLSFLFAEDEQLYDRCVILHTTFIPYREFERVLGIKGIDEYIRYGGTMSLSGELYNQNSIFVNVRSAYEYVNSAIANNIQHSLKNYKNGGHFRNLVELYEKNELTSAINRVVEDINHRFTVDVLTRDFKSNDLSLSQRNLRKDTTVLDKVNIDDVTKALRVLLEIKNKDRQSVTITDAHIHEIEEYLYLLELIDYVDVISLSDTAEKKRRVIITQPGLRYTQAEALIKSLMMDPVFSSLSIYELEDVRKRILNEIKGRMLEDIVLLETKRANPDKEVFVLKFPVGEFDMVVFDSQALTSAIFEIKYSADVFPSHYRHLIDEEKCQQTEHRYGKITQKAVLYRGKGRSIEDVEYINVEEYLKGLRR